jgi:hypothetical protein
MRSDALFGAGLNEEKGASASARSADLGASCAAFTGDFHQTVDERSSNSGSVLAAERPFLAQQAARFLPILRSMA